MSSPASSSRRAERPPRRLRPTVARKRGRTSGACSAATANGWRTAARPGSRRCRRPSSGTTRGSGSRRHDGRVQRAAGLPRSTAMPRTEVAFGATSTALVCRRERLALAAWLDPVAIPPADWTGLLRSGLVRQPLAAAREAEREDAARRRWCAVCWSLPPGRSMKRRSTSRSAIAIGHRKRRRSTPPPALPPGSRACSAATRRPCRLLDAAVDEADRAGRDLGGPDREGRPTDRSGGRRRRLGGRRRCLCRGGRPVGTCHPRRARGLGTAVHRATRTGRRLRSAEVRLAAAERAAAGFRRLGAGVPEAWARGLAALALAETGADDARDAALGAESFARATGTPGARLLAYLAMAAAEPARAVEYSDLAAAVRAETGLHASPVWRARRLRPARARRPWLRRRARHGTARAVA